MHPDAEGLPEYPVSQSKSFWSPLQENRDPDGSTMWGGVCRHRRWEIWCEGQVVIQLEKNFPVLVQLCDPHDTENSHLGFGGPNHHVTRFLKDVLTSSCDYDFSLTDWVFFLFFEDFFPSFLVRENPILLSSSDEYCCTYREDVGNRLPLCEATVCWGLGIRNDTTRTPEDHHYTEFLRLWNYERVEDGTIYYSQWVGDRGYHLVQYGKGHGNGGPNPIW